MILWLQQFSNERIVRFFFFDIADYFHGEMIQECCFDYVYMCAQCSVISSLAVFFFNVLLSHFWNVDKVRNHPVPRIIKRNKPV